MVPRLVKATMSAVLLLGLLATVSMCQPASSLKWPPLASPRLRELQQQLKKEDDSTLVRFWVEMQKRGTPLIERIPGQTETLLVTFLWQGSDHTRNVVVFMQPGGSDPASNQLELLPNSDVWYRSYTFRNDVRFLYSLSPNDDLTPLTAPNIDWQKRFANLQVDPLNPKRFPAVKPTGPVNVQSVVELPAAPRQPWVVTNPRIPAGHVVQEEFESKSLGNKRKVWVYLPAAYAAGTKPLSVLVLFDGQSYLDQVPTPVILDNLIAAGKIPPTIAVLLDNVDRDKDLGCSRPFADALTKELLPWLRGRYRLTADPAQTVIAGSSMGGLAATCTAMWYPNRFGNFLAQSSSYYWKPDDANEFEWLAHQFATGPKLPLRAFVTVGQLELLPRPGNTNQLEVNRRFRDALRSKGYDVTYTEFDGAHEYIDWQGTLADGLIALLGRRTRVK